MTGSMPHFTTTKASVNKGVYLSFLGGFALSFIQVWSGMTMQASIAPYFLEDHLPRNQTTTTNKSLESTAMMINATLSTQEVLPSESTSFWPEALPPREYFDNCPDDSMGRIYTPPNKQQYFDDYYNIQKNNDIL